MSDKPKWTPGPCRLGHDIEGDCHVYADNAMDVVTGGILVTDAELIVRAVNSFEAMREALELALERLEHPAVHDAFRADSVQYDHLDATIVIARAALRKSGAGDV